MHKQVAGTTWMLSHLLQGAMCAWPSCLALQATHIMRSRNPERSEHAYQAVTATKEVRRCHNTFISMQLS